MARWRGYFRPKGSAVLGQPRPGRGRLCPHGFALAHAALSCPVCWADALDESEKETPDV